MTELTRDYAVRVYGDPAPKGSMKCIGARGKIKHQLIEDNDRTTPWRELIAKAGRALPVSGLVGPVGVEVTITIARPKSHYRTGRNAHLLKDSAPLWPHQTGTGDSDKYVRNVLDGFEDAGLYGNDAQVCEHIGRKVYPDTPGAADRLDRPGAVLRIYPIGA